jgi:hypothetical protein
MDMYIDQSYFHDRIGRERILATIAPYHDWVECLPPPVRACCRDLIREEIANSNLVNLPFLLAEPFAVADRRIIDTLVVGNAFMITYFLASDRLLDAPAGADRHTILLATLLHGEMLSRYEEVLPGRAAALWASIVRDHVEGVMQEEEHHALSRAGAAGHSPLAYKAAIIRKNRYGMAAIALLAARSDRHDCGRVLAQVYDHMAVEIEFDDDLKDWHEDLREGRFTPVVLGLAEAAGSRSREAMRAVLARSPVVPIFLDELDAHLKQAEDLLAAADFPCRDLQGWLARHREANARLRRDFLRSQIRHALARAFVTPSKPATLGSGAAVTQP